MTATDEQIAELRRKVAEPTYDNYSDALLADYIERYPLVDSVGEAPYIDDDGELEDNEYWTPTYDLNAAAAAIWSEKASTLAGNYDFSADGASYHRSQAYKQAQEQARYYSARRSIKTVTLRPEPKLSSGTLAVEEESV
jgi:hypothetical protein